MQKRPCSQRCIARPPPDQPEPYYRPAMTAAGNHQASRPTGRRLGRAGIRDVAAAAGVSITTVSDALNGKGRLPDATRRHVREVADRLGYRPSAAARTLRTGKSGLIGLTVTTYGEEPFTFTEFAYFAEMAQRRHLGRAGPRLRPGDPARVLAPRRVGQRRAGRHRGHRPLRPRPGRHRTGPAGRARWSATAARPATCPVHRLGRQRPRGRPSSASSTTSPRPAPAGSACSPAPAPTPTPGCPPRAYLDWCERVGQEPVYEAYPAHDPCAGAVAADRLLARPDRPDAVYGLFDPNGTDLLAAARRYGLRVPDDLLLVCCSESDGLRQHRAADHHALAQAAAGSAPRSCSCSSTRSRGSAPHSRCEQVMPTELIVRTSSQRRPPRTTVEPAAHPRTTELTARSTTGNRRDLTPVRRDLSTRPRLAGGGCVATRRRHSYDGRMTPQDASAQPLQA